MLEIKPLNNLAVYLDRLIKDRLWLKVIIGLVLGTGFGIVINPNTGFVSENFSLWLANWLDLPGQVFMRLVQMIMIPLIFASIITGIVGNTSENLKIFLMQFLTLSLTIHWNPF